MTHYDVAVLGAGGVGSAAAYHAARLGAKVVALDRFDPPHDRGSSHGATRIIRQAYYEHPDYVPLAGKAFESWAQLEAHCGERLYRQTGLLEASHANGKVVSGVLASAAKHGLNVQRLEANEVVRRWPGLMVPDGMQAVFEPSAGYLLVERCVRAHLEGARRLGAVIEPRVEVTSWRAAGQSVEVVANRRISAGALIIAAGAWAAPLLAELALPLAVRRKSVFWFAEQGEYRAADGFPCFLLELPEGIFYGIPAIDDWGVKIAEHTGGTPLDDPLSVDRGIEPEEQRRVEAFAGEYLPRAQRPCSRHTVCLYTMTPDAHFIVGRHPLFERVFLAAGLSGHGFKFTGVLGRALAELALEGTTALPIDFLSPGRRQQAG